MSVNVNFASFTGSRATSKDSSNNTRVLVGDDAGIQVNIPPPYLTLESCSIKVLGGIKEKTYTEIAPTIGSYSRDRVDANGYYFHDQWVGGTQYNIIKQAHFDFFWGCDPQITTVHCEAVVKYYNPIGQLFSETLIHDLPVSIEEPDVDFSIVGQPLTIQRTAPVTLSAAGNKMHCVIHNTTPYAINVSCVNLESGYWSKTINVDNYTWSKSCGYIEETYSSQSNSIYAGQTYTYDYTLGPYQYTPNDVVGANPVDYASMLLKLKTSLWMNKTALRTATWHANFQYNKASTDVLNCGPGETGTGNVNIGWTTGPDEYNTMPEWNGTVHDGSYPNQ